MKTKINETKKYQLLSFIRYLGDGLFYPFFSLYLSSTGLLESKIGFILSISPLIGIIMNPIYSKFCKSMEKTRKCLRTISILEAIIIITIPFFNNFYVLSTLAFFMAIFGSCHYGLMDSLCAVYCNDKKINFSSIRVFGSSAYIIATAIGGFICEYIGYKTTFIISGSAFIIGALIYECLCPIYTTVKKEEITTKYKDLFKNKHFVFFLIFYFLFMGNFFTNNNFYGVYLESRGVTKDLYGFVYSYFVIFEVVILIFLNKKGKKFSHNQLLVIASISIFIMLFANYLYLPIPIVLALSAFRGIGFGIALHVSYDHIVSIVSKKDATLAIMLCTLLQQIFVVMFNNIGGNIIEHSSYKTYYLCASIVGIIVIFISLLRLFIYKKEKLNIE